MWIGLSVSGLNCMFVRLWLFNFIILIIMITDRKEALLLLKQKQQGKISDLIQAIAPNLVESFKSLGFVVLGCGTWRITSAGVGQCEFYHALTGDKAESSKQ